MDSELINGIMASAIVLVVLMLAVLLFCKVVSFLFNVVFPPQTTWGTVNESSRQISGINNFSLQPRRVLAIDTEMVGAGDRGQINMLARVSIVDRSYCFYDKYVAPVLPVTDYRTFVSGIRPNDLIGAESFYTVQRQVQAIIKDRVLVGHDVEKDLRALELSHPAKHIRDTALYRPFRMVANEKPSLKYLARCILRRSIQYGKHDSAEDAQAAMDLYLMVADQWERSLLY